MSNITKKHDIKTQLAKMMATENIDVRFDNVETASFDPKTRVLTIPNYKDDLSREEYDLFIGHEVGHALYTPHVRPNEVDTTRKDFGGFVNVVEDVRIEKAIQAKFPGLTRSFRAGYSDLINRGFFGKDINYDTMNLGDKANMFFKAGFHHTGISFSDDEQKIIDDIDSANTWEKVIKAAQDLYDFCDGKGQEDNQDTEDGDDGDDGESAESEEGTGGAGEGKAGDKTEADESADSSDGESAEGEADDDGDDARGGGDDEASAGGDDADGDGEGEEKNTDKTTGNTRNAKGSADSLDGDPPVISTQKAFDEKSKDLHENKRLYNTPVNGVVPTATEHSALGWKDVYADIAARVKKYDATGDALARYTKVWNEFKVENNGIVAYLAKEFEMRKSADEHERTREAKTGALNTSILHTYKFNEDLFMKAAVVEAGKNHGLIMVVDWSGSMDKAISDTISQIQVLAMFCRKVNIPFDVYAFNGHYSGQYNATTGQDFRDAGGELKNSFSSNDGEVMLEGKYAAGSFKLVNYLSSTMRNAQFETAMAYFTMVKDTFSGHSAYTAPYGSNPMMQNGGWHRLGGTPLVEAVVATARVVNEFRDKYRLQVVNTIFLTDGQGNSQQAIHGASSSHGELILHDKKTKQYYRNRSEGYYGSFQNYLDWFADNTGTRIINFYVYGSSVNDLNSAFRSFDIPERYEGHGIEKIINKDELKQLTKKGYYYRDDVAGYHSVIFLRTKNLKIAEDKMEALDPEATLAQTRKAFITNQRDKVGSRMFMDHVAQLIS